MTSLVPPPSIPSRATAVVTCIDTRIDPLGLLQAGPGELHIIRNAGALVTDDVIRSLVVSQTRGETSRIQLIMHTDCAVHGLAPTAEIDGQVVATGGYQDLEATLADGVAILRTQAPLLHRDQVSGFIYDVISGKLHRHH